MEEKTERTTKNLNLTMCMVELVTLVLFLCSH